MDAFARAIINNRKLVLILFLVLCLVSVLLIPLVDINYNISDYLPKQARSTTGIEVITREFDQAVPNATVMVQDVSLVEALHIKERLSGVEGVTEVLWLDSVVDLKQPLEMQDAETVESFYKNGSALFLLSVKKGMEAQAYRAIREIVGPEGAIAGEVANLTDMQNSATSEVRLAVTVLLPAIIIILVLSTSSWLEPLFFLAAIGVSVVINMGSNIVFREISFVTNSISPILQLAVSMDYAIFLLHKFADYRKEHDDVNTAMYRAVKASAVTVASSALTTLFGFLALVFMDFGIGPDLGVCLAKGIIFSFVSVMVFLPALALTFYRLIDKTAHRPLMPDFKNIGRVLSGIFIPVTIVVGLAVLPAFLAQGQTVFMYGNSAEDPNRDIGRSNIAITEQFGRTNILALLVPKGDIVKEYELSVRLSDHPFIKNVVSYATSVGTTVPAGFLDEEITGQFYSDNYARIVLYANMPPEGDVTFRTVEEINATVSEYYDDYYLVGQSATLHDIKHTVDKDNVRVNAIAVLAIFLVVALAFKSLALPFILLLAIEVAIWVNLSFPYFLGTTVNFVGYLVLCTVQLGATIDYAILLTDTYMEKRKTMPPKEAIFAALSSAFKSVLVSASILSFAGFTLYLTSSNSIVRDIGLLLGRGTLISMFMVVCFLPAMLTLLDKVIGKTTWRANFYQAKHTPKS